MRITTIITPELIKTNLESQEKEEVFGELVNVLVQNGKISDGERALEAIEKREALGTTGIGRGVAIPHAKDESIQELVAACGISREGIEFDAVDGEPVYIVFLVLAEANNPGPHVQLLAEIARILQLPGIFEKLKRAKTPEEIYTIFDTAETEEEDQS